MNIFYILTSCTFVSVLAISPTEYKNKILYVDYFIEQAANQNVLSKIIIDIVCGSGYTMQQLAVLFIVPERVDVRFLKISDEHNDDLLKRIKTALPRAMKAEEVKVNKTDSLLYGYRRREFVQKRIKEIIINTPIPVIKEDKKEVKKEGENQCEKGPTINFRTFCYLMGLLKCSGSLEKVYITQAEIIDGQCVLSANLKREFAYDSIGNIKRRASQVSFDV